MPARVHPEMVTIPASAARRLLLHAQGLLEDAAAPVDAASVQRLIERMGYVQIDSINMVERAHHLTLFSRLPGYRPEHLRQLHEGDRSLFEHWTHDASLIPVSSFQPWKRRSIRFVSRVSSRDWLKRRLGPKPRKVIDEVRGRIECEGPLQSRDFERAPSKKGHSSAWWGWKPQKAALEYLWWRGDLTVAARINFHKVYDLTERVYPHHHALEPPHDEEWVEWACRNAIERVVVASPREIAGFFGGVTIAEATAWCRAAGERGEVVAARVESVDGSKPRPGFALPDWRERLARAEAALSPLEGHMRLLSPFDPVLRDRARALRLFGFDYRFEAFVPAPKRRYGYYVLPIMQGERMIGRADFKHHRDRETLIANGVWWEKGVKPTRVLKARFKQACEELATFIGARHVELPR
ncbi:MAG: winged helix-turn-helix domain-containing protein [Phycisphaeraceae bacterium]|nr:winged helix DNA-binding domain-containing protein [Phycisphaerales bacterium]QOJ16975.1 MAG: winged helix-turn-helix domain-containing protein [Phycisphaeraceae bacterium]